MWRIYIFSHIHPVWFHFTNLLHDLYFVVARLKFWKSSRHKIFALYHGIRGKSRHNKREREAINVESDHEEPITKKVKDELYLTVLSLDYKVEEIKEDIARCSSRDSTS